MSEKKKYWSTIITATAVPKARPRVTKHGTYMPQRYMDNKTMLAWAIKAGATKSNPLPEFKGPVRMVVQFSSTQIGIEIWEADNTRPKGVRGDIDNLLGTITDVLQDMGIIVNDREIYGIEGTFT